MDLTSRLREEISHICNDRNITDYLSFDVELAYDAEWANNCLKMIFCRELTPVEKESFRRAIKSTYGNLTDYRHFIKHVVDCTLELVEMFIDIQKKKVHLENEKSGISWKKFILVT